MNILDICPVPHLQETWEFSKLAEIYLQLKPKKVIEIGSFYGATLWAWANMMERSEYSIGSTGKFYTAPSAGHIVSVDYPIGPSDGRYEEMIRCRDLWQSWMAGIHFHDIQGDSHARVTIERVGQILPEKDVDFLFIDGDHSYGGVKADYQNYSQFVRPGGLIVFHDVVGLPEVAKLWNEVKRGQRYQEIYAGPNGWGIGIIEKQ